MSAQPQPIAPGRKRFEPLRRLPGLLFCLIVLSVTGCVNSPVRPVPETASQSPLQQWTEEELAPYLAQQFTRHPRFKGEPVVLVRLQGPDISPEIDNLTRGLRDQIRDALLSTPGIRLPWQPQRRQEQHHRRPQGVHCRQGPDADHFIGIEIGPTANDQFRVSVRALDVRAGEWVSGFGKSWVGPLTASELLALGESRADESLRGLRVLPFDSGQSDLAAAYLANNLSCLLRQQAEADLLLYVEPNQTDKKGVDTLLKLVGNNLSRYREVRVTDKREEANLLLRGEAHEVQPGLYQVWTVLRSKRSGEHLTGVDTAAYLRLPANVAPAHNARVPKSARSRRPAQPRLDLLGPRHGRWSTDACRGRTEEACRTLQLSVEKADQVFVFALDANHLTRVYPGACRHRIEPVEAGTAGHAYLFPETPVASDRGTVYAIAVNEPQLKTRFAQLLNDLPDACMRVEEPPMSGRELDAWLRKLDRLIEGNGDRVTWTARRLP